MSASPQTVTRATQPWLVRFYSLLWRILQGVWSLLLFSIAAGTISNLAVVEPDKLRNLFIIKIISDHPFPAALSFGTLVLLTTICWIGNRYFSDTFSLSPTQQDRNVILRQLRGFYEHADSLMEELFQSYIWIKLKVSIQPDKVKPSSVSLPDTEMDIREAYNKAGGSLLILGEAGSGKSTLLVKLALHLIEEAEKDSSQPFPMIISLSSWAIARKYRSLEDWLCEQIALINNISPSISQMWVQEGWVLPLLDGFDEIKEAQRPGCIKAINDYLRQVRPLVVCSRTEPYKKVSEQKPLALNCAVGVQPLKMQQWSCHLRDKPALLSALEQNRGALRDLAEIPLRLNILRILDNDDNDDLPKQMWKRYSELLRQRYSELMASSDDESNHYQSQDTKKWLCWIAQKMQQHKQRTFYLKNLQPDWLPSIQRDLYRLSLIPGYVVLFIGVIGLFVNIFNVFESLLSILTPIMLPMQNPEGRGEDFWVWWERVCQMWQSHPTSYLMFTVLLFMCMLLFALLPRAPFILFKVFRTLVFRTLLHELIQWIQFYILLFWLWQAHRLPQKVEPFLEEATSRHLLVRVAGGGYKFIYPLPWTI
jgi:energy-coupling factor transporter ATP-binding protein EcfA2